MKTETDPNTKQAGGDDGSQQPEQIQSDQPSPQVIQEDVDVDWSQKGLDIDSNDPNVLSK